MGDTPTTPKVQVFSPTGDLVDLPYDQLHSALADGAKIAAKMKAPDGTVTFIPGDRVPEAMKDGGVRVPLDGNDADGGQPGFWSQTWGKFKSQIPSSIPEAAKAMGGSSFYDAARAIPQGPQAVAAQLPGGPAALEYLRSRDAGAGVGRSALNAAGASVGVNPAEEEAQARAGNTAGVAADAAVPIAETLLGYGAHLAAPATGEALSNLASNYKPELVNAAEALKEPQKLPGKAAMKLVDLIPGKPEYPGASLPSYEDYAANRGAEMNQARAMQDVQIRREATAKATAERAAAKADIAARQPVPLSDSPNYPKWKADQAAAAQAAKDAAKADAQARQAVPVSQSPYYAQNQAATAAEEAARKPVPVNQSPYYNQNQAAMAEAVRPAQPLNPVSGPPVPTPDQLAQGVKLSDLVGEKPSGITVVPEPRAPFAGETPNYMASVPRGTLQDLALAGKPGAGTQLQQLGQPVLYAPSGAGISNLKSSIALRDLLGSQPGDFAKPTSNIKLSPGEDLGPGLGTEHTIHTPDGKRIGSVTVEPKGDGVLHVNWLGGDLAGNATRSDIMNALKQEYPGTTKLTYDRRRLAAGADAATTEPREMNVGSGS